MSDPDEMAPTLAAVAICRNEEVDLPGFLENFVPWVDEIVLVDEFSTDRTAEIARAAGNKVKLIQRRRDAESGFAGQRNAGIAIARSTWLLHLDIDNRAPPELAQEIRHAIEDDEKNAFYYRRVNFFLHRQMRGTGLQHWNYPWLARRDKCSFENVLHERCIVEGGPCEIGQLHCPMWHLNDDSYNERLRKSFQYCEIEAMNLLNTGRQVRWFDFLIQPLWVIIKRYVRHNAFRDGIPGLIFTLHSADAVFRAYALAWDTQHCIPRETLEDLMREAWRGAAISTSPSDSRRFQ